MAASNHCGSDKSDLFPRLFILHKIVFLQLVPVVLSFLGFLYFFFPSFKSFHPIGKRRFIFSSYFSGEAGK